MNDAGDLRSTNKDQAEADAWLIRLRSGEATVDDLQAFRRWCEEHPKAAQSLRATWSRLGTAAAEVAREEAMSGQTWTGNPPFRATTVFRPGRRAFVGVAVAAGASWLALRPPLELWPALGDLAADYRTGRGEQRRIALSERVSVDMNTQTRINVLPVRSGLRGIELLAGEVEIDARTPTGSGSGSGAGSGADRVVRAVVVTAGSGRLSALVAQFNVRRTDGDVCVTCVSGVVAIEHLRRRLNVLAGQQLIYNDSGMQPVSQVDPSAITAWREGALVFNGTPLAQVIDEINRYRRGRLILRSATLGKSQVQARIPLDRLEGAVDMLGKLYGAHVTRLPGGIVLLS